MMDEPGRRLPPTQGQLEGCQDELGAQVVGHGPAHHPAAEAIQDDRQVPPPVRGRHVADVRQPDPIGGANRARRQNAVHLEMGRTACRERV
jgi:hypothetical protein